LLEEEDKRIEFVDLFQESVRRIEKKNNNVYSERRCYGEAVGGGQNIVTYSEQNVVTSGEQIVVTLAKNKT
jgi:hypothetical protein